MPPGDVTSRIVQPRRPMLVFGPLTLGAILCSATLALIWFGYQATERSQENAKLLLERRLREQLALLWSGVTQDMKGAHATVIAPIAAGPLLLGSPYDAAEAFARGFARFPYPESFFIWRAHGASDGATYVFSRTERPPAWDTKAHAVDPYPVVTLRDPPGALGLIAEARRRAAKDRRSVVFSFELAGVPYQAVVSYQYHTDEPERLVGLVGFTVNLNWVRQKYFDELAVQIARIGGSIDDVSLAILDESQRPVTMTHPVGEQFAPVDRQFPLSFADRALLGSPSERFTAPIWTARAGVARDGPLVVSAALGDKDRFVLMSVVAGVMAIGLLLTARGVHVAAQVARMKSDFVLNITHDLKTPLAVIRLLADALVNRRYESEDSARDYAARLSRESSNLSTRINHLLAYARLSDVQRMHTFEAVDIAEVIDHVMAQFELLLADRQFTNIVEVAPDLPLVPGDRSALMQALENLLDNAMRYSDDVRELRVTAAAADGLVTVCVADRGAGIDPEDIDRVGEKFVRGRNVGARGTGLGLAIARQIIEDHHGSLTIHSRPGEGTSVRMMLPVLSVA